MHESLRQFHPVIGRWFEERVGVPTPPQVMGWPIIGGKDGGRSCLILAPTGSGKTLAAFLAAIDWVARRMMGAGGLGVPPLGGGGDSLREGPPEGGTPNGTLSGTPNPNPIHGVQILYVSPLKSLANDVQKNLVAPLREIGDVAARMGVDWPEIAVAVRTGDTPRKERAAMARRPPHILITTPESLNLMVTSGMRSALGAVRYLIVDEVHALAGSKRGVFLSLILERLEEERKHEDTKARRTTKTDGEELNHRGTETQRVAQRRVGRGVKIAPGVYVDAEPVGEMVRVGLSATARPEERIARWLAGFDGTGKPRGIEIARSGQRKRLDLGVVCPFGPAAEEVETTGTGETKVRGTGHWPEVTRAVLRMIRDHRSTLVFGNSRRLIESLAARLAEEVNAEGEMRNAEGGEGMNAEGEMRNAEGGEGMNAECEMRNAEGGREMRGGRRVPVILPHHGSIAKEVRLETEQALKRGELDAVLATSSLELGIDIGALDLVVQIDSPGNVAAALQRVGRAGHLEKATAKGRLLARGLWELASFAALVPLMYEGVVEETRIPENCLDVLAQQVVAACVVRPWKRLALFAMFRRAMPFATLTEKQFDSVVGMLSKRAERVTSQGSGGGRPRLSFDRVNDELIIMPGASSVLMMNSGVISDTGAFPVYLAGGKKGRVETGIENAELGMKKGGSAPREAAQDRGKFGGLRIGELDEEFVYETKEGDRIVLGSQTWRVVRIDADRVLVEHAAAGSSRMPFWRGEQAPRSEMVGEAVGRFYGEVEGRMNAEGGMRNAEGRGNAEGGESVREWLVREHHFDERAAENAVGYYERQMARGSLPNLGRIVVEHFLDRTGEPIIAIFCPLGRRVNYTLRLGLEAEFAKRRLPAQLVHSDDGVIIRPPFEVGEIPENPLAWLRPATLEQEIVDQLESSSLFGLRFRQNAARALMLPRMNVTQRTPLWQQRLRARHLLALVKKERNFPIIVETYRECLQDVLGIERVEKLVGQMERGEVAVRVVRNSEPSPFARSLFSQFQQSYLYAWDDPLLQADAEPTVDQTVLDEILRRRGEGMNAEGGMRNAEGGGGAPWEMVDEEVLERRIVAADYPARTAEELLEKIEAAGAVGVRFGMGDDARWGEWVVGGGEEAGRMLGELSEKRRLFCVGVGKVKGQREGPGIAIPGLGVEAERRWVAAENLGLLIAAMGKRPGLRRFVGGKLVAAKWSEVPAALLKTELGRGEARRLLVEQAVKRRAVTSLQEVNAECGMRNAEGEVGAIVEDLVRSGFVQSVGEVAEGRIVWTEYAEQLRSLALRRQRRAASTADVAALQRHLLRWQNLESPREGIDSLEDALDMLTGVSLPLELWELEILPTRVKEFSPAMLDGICLAGHRVWVGMGGGGGGAGGAERGVSFWPRHLLGERGGGVAKERPPEGGTPNGERVLDFLRMHGASFLMDLQMALSLDDTETALALEELAFAGRISNDQLEGLREVMRLAENARRDSARRPELPRANDTGRYPAGIRGGAAPRKLSAGWWKRRMAASGVGGAQSLGGRWFILPEARTPQTALEVTERAADKVERFLRRTGFACRELLDAQVDGSWRDCYDVLTRMEWAGSVRRGYFVDGIGGSQFAAMGAAVGMNAEGGMRNAEGGVGGNRVVWISMLDPGNVWARVNTRWLSDAGEPVRIARAAGNWIALVEGRPVLAAVNWGHRLIPLPAAEELHLAAARTFHTLLARLPRKHRPHLDVREWDGQDIVGSPVDEILRSAEGGGFTRDTQGLRLYRQYIPHAGAVGRLSDAAAIQLPAPSEGESQ